MIKNRIFISYSWDSEIHKQWVLELANRLEEIEELHVVLDKYDLDSFSDKNHFMEQGVFNSDLILIISTEEYIKKSNSRQGGVGIEACLASAKHWDEISNENGSNILVLRRSGDSSPNYLKEKLYINFSNNDLFEESFKNLLGHISGTSKTKRPEKRLSIQEAQKIKDFTKSEDIIKINHKKRNLLFNRKDCVDYSAGQKIKFELWETLSPRVDYYLILFKNHTIKETINRFCDLLNKNNLNISELTVLRPSIGDTVYLEKLFKDNEIDISLTEVTYSDFIWEYCIDDEAKEKEEIFVNPFFIDQTLIYENHDGIEDLGLASDFIKNEFTNEQQSSALVVIAPGGMGKTTLCQKIAHHFQKQPKSAAVFIQAETIKNSKTADLIENFSIDTIYDLYEIYAKICSSEYPDSFTYDKTTFDLSLLSGNLVVIVDGIDEMLSIFPENFNIKSLVTSINEINNQLGNSKILLTSRNDIFSNGSNEETEEIKKLTLLGFDETTCKQYLWKRFKDYEERPKYSDEVMLHLKRIIEQDSDEHILPFLVDLISGVVEESQGDNVKFDISLHSKEYESNNSIIDCLVYSVLRREFRRQNLEIPIEEIIGIFQEMAIRYGDIFPVSALEEHISIYYDEISTSLPRKMLLNPLIVKNNDFCKFKYDFLADYFVALYMIEYINLGATDKQFISLLAKHAYGDKQALKDVKKYFELHSDKFIESSSKIVKGIVKTISAKDTVRENDDIYKAFSALCHIAASLPISLSSKEKFTNTIKKIYHATNKIEHLSLYGKFPPLDFTDIEVWNSRFVRFEKFISSKFQNTKFYYSYFDGIKPAYMPKSFDKDMFDSCRLGDLSTVIEQATSYKKHNQKTIEKEIHKFLTSFFNRGTFKDQKKRYIKIPGKNTNVKNKIFDSLIKNKFIIIKIRKSNATYYEISPSHHKSVYGFINNNIINSEIRQIVETVEQITNQFT